MMFSWVSLKPQKDEKKLNFRILRKATGPYKKTYFENKDLGIGALQETSTSPTTVLEFEDYKFSIEIFEEQSNLEDVFDSVSMVMDCLNEYISAH